MSRAIDHPNHPSSRSSLAARCQATNTDANLMGDHQRNTVANVLQPHASGNVGDPPLFPIERDFGQILSAACTVSSKPNLVTRWAPTSGLQEKQIRW